MAATFNELISARANSFAFFSFSAASCSLRLAVSNAAIFSIFSFSAFSTITRLASSSFTLIISFSFSTACLFISIAACCFASSPCWTFKADRRFAVNSRILSSSLFLTISCGKNDTDCASCNWSIIESDVPLCSTFPILVSSDDSYSDLFSLLAVEEGFFCTSVALLSANNLRFPSPSLFCSPAIVAAVAAIAAAALIASCCCVSFIAS